MSTLRVAHVVLSLDVGGLEHVVLNLVREGPRLEQAPVVICLERPGRLASELTVPVLALGKPDGVRPELVVRLRRLFRELRPDVVHTHQVGALAYAGPAAWSLGVPVVVHTEHGKHYHHWRRRWLGWFAARFVARYFCVSQDIADACASRVVPHRKLAVVPNGIDLNRFADDDGGRRRRMRQALDIPPQAFVAGTVGRLDEIKRQEVLIGGFARLLHDRSDARLLLVGDGPRRVELQNLTAALGLTDRVHFAGYQSRPEDFLPALDVFTLTSRSEGMPMAVLEAWACGLPVVASRVGGLPELIAEGRTGLLFDPGDEAALAAALARLAHDPQHARRLGREGRREAESRFSLRRMAQTYHGHYIELRDRRGHRFDENPRDHEPVPQPVPAQSGHIQLAAGPAGCRAAPHAGHRADSLD